MCLVLLGRDVVPRGLPQLLLEGGYQPSSPTEKRIDTYYES
jgi:hypothetical protein